MTRKHRTPSSEELRLWREVMREVAPWRRLPVAAPSVPVATSTPVSTPVATPGAVAPAAPPVPAARAHHAPLLPGQQGGLDRRTDDKLRRGRMEIDGRIDLHGMTQAQAHDALIGFVLRGYREGRRTLLVITGKGKPGAMRGAAYDDGDGGRGVLRLAVPRWLGEGALRPLVLAVRQAQPQHGGGGALYVLLRRQRP